MSLLIIRAEESQLRAERPRWSGDEVQVWRVCTDAPTDTSILSGDERERAARFQFAGHRTPWIAARVFLRRVLSGYVGCRADALRFVLGTYGKPALYDGAVRFNLSHTGNLAVCAVSQSVELGVDVERIRPVADMDGVFGSICSPAEARAWQDLDWSLRSEAFFRCWTKKESCAKAAGIGLSAPVRLIETLVQPTAASHVVACAGRRWRVCAFQPAEGVAGALAIEHRND